jgi:uncharacterized integral membrane protein (TIGR00698 family)
MPFTKSNRHHTLNGILFACLFALSSFYIANLNFIKHLGFSPLVIAIILGMIYGSTLRKHLPHEWQPGIQFVAKKVLRVAIVLYGFRLTFQDVLSVGWGGFGLDLFIVISTMCFGTLIGIKLFKLDRDTSILISSGAAICGAAAVLATEGVLKSEPHKAAFAIISVVLFGTIAMFLYPLLQHINWLHFTNTQYGIYVGATIHEVAQVIVAGSQISPISGNTALIVKMTRVMLLAPMLIILGICVKNGKKSNFTKTIPWFAVLFIVMVGFNSLQLLSQSIVSTINDIDLFLLTLAMAALGIETDFTKITAIGPKPLYLALFLFIWLMLSGFFVIYKVTI